MLNDICEQAVKGRKRARATRMLIRQCAKLQEALKTVRGETNRILKTEKWEFMSNMIHEIEKANKILDSRNMFQILKHVENGHRNNQLIINDKDGNMLTDKKSILNRWREYFEKLLNAEDPKSVFQ